jgi:hypothetical protein
MENIMDIIQTIRNNHDLLEKVRKFCDIEIYPKDNIPQDEGGPTVWNIDGMAFGCDGTGEEYILLKDSSIGFNGSEGQCGRVAENITKLFELLINCSCWMDYTNTELYENDNKLEKYILKMEKHYEENWGDKNVEKELSEKLSIKIYDNIIDLMKRFYKTAIREPKYIYIVTMENGTRIKSEGSLIE